MGAYLDTPVTAKQSSHGSCSVGSRQFVYASTAMQGWRVNMEDAHVVLPDFDESTALFAVFDGHGGKEVAEYCSRRMPEMLQSNASYKSGDLPTALRKLFMETDGKLLEEDAVRELKRYVAGAKEGESDTEVQIDSSDEKEEASKLLEEADMPLDKLLAHYMRGSDEQDKEEKSPNEQVRSMLEALASGAGFEIKFEESSDSEDDSEYETEEDEDTDAVRETEKGEGEREDREGKDGEDAEGEREERDREEEGEGEERERQEGEDGREGRESGRVDVVQNQEERAVVDGECGRNEESGNISDALSTTSQSLVVKQDQTNDDDSGVGQTCFPLSIVLESSRENNCNNNTNSSHSGQEMAPETLSAKGMLKDRDVLQLNGGVAGHASDDSTHEDSKGSHASNSGTENYEHSSKSHVLLDLLTSATGCRITRPHSEALGTRGTHKRSREETNTSSDGAKKFCRGVLDEEGYHSGTTAVVCLLRENSVTVANAGDSRCVLAHEGEAVDLSEDHKPTDVAELSRIQRAGGCVGTDERVNGGLNLSRAIGDHFYKENTSLSLEEQMITAMPDVESRVLQSGDEFIVVACDGIWNAKSSQEVVAFVRSRLSAKRDDDTTLGQLLENICEELCDECLAADTDNDGTGCDNMTVVIILFS